MKKKTRALVLFSGGLDSIMACKVLSYQGIDVMALTLVSYFFDDKKAQESAKRNMISWKSLDISKKHEEIVKSPKRGYGKAINPCIDCHLLMIQEAGRIMQGEDFDFLATGEVLGQRPMSQNMQSLNLIERDSGIKGRLLRPLSAKLLEETDVERTGLVRRVDLLDFSGRSRKRHFELLDKYGISYYPNPGGGCLLTEVEFGKKLRKLWETMGKENVSSGYTMLKTGRSFWLERAHLIVGRNHKENQEIIKIARKGDIIVMLADFEGPTALLRGETTPENIKFAREKVASYSRHTRGNPIENIKFKISHIV